MDLEARIRASIAKAKEMGYRIVDGTWIIDGDDYPEDKCCCALGACLVADNVPRTPAAPGSMVIDWEGVAARHLQIPVDSVRAIICGFDDNESASNKADYLIGQRLRNELSPELPCDDNDDY